MFNRLSGSMRRSGNRSVGFESKNRTSTQSLCARCADLGLTCCQRSQIFLTLGDIRRIRKATGLDSGFFRRATPSQPEYLADPEVDPLWNRIFGLDGDRRILASQSSGDCFFLGCAGCRLSLPIRPLVCRLYPYEYNPSGITGVSGQYCPSPERDAPALLLALLAMNREAAETWRRILYLEIQEEFP
ncbi:MAG: YkgJ family cysteine cluster protein [Planctomycetota bacterium]|jgi:Fe-S-cluster containining protein|nr:YkgJ family cysteine cluster protein [Planctomycetota bacterium]